MEVFGQILLGAGVTAGFHPISYVKTLIQLGYEPLPAVPSTSIFGRKKVHGKPFQKSPPPPSTDELDGDDETVVEQLIIMVKDTCYETIARCSGVVVSHPFHVIMVRQMAQFIGKETTYNNIFSSVSEIYEKDGILGFFVSDSGIIPPKLMVTQVTYPFMLVSNVMIVNNSGLKAGGSPFSPFHQSWLDCWSYLARQNALKRGSSVFMRYYKGPVTFRRDGQMVPADY
ncbi:hypothetical protein LSH36_9g09043 [Paralvinella palmiformis]|uniref:Uncharacterized protein n=1 Tax=Paralvinella palmiformis TaxID=53620 RepID=A0AAD9NIG5_9ANNE|nr:hypothetical protein LSH36_9g09043 [Paralvinella palmiformis]